MLRDDGRERGRRFLGSPVPAAFEVRRVIVAPGAVRPYDEAEWLDAIVVVECGEFELECSRGGRRRFRRGDVLWLAGLPLRALHGCEEGPAVLLAVSRRRSDEFPIRPPSYHHRHDETNGETEMNDDAKEGR